MAYPVIQSRTNAKIKDGCRLTALAKYRREQGLFTLEGLRLCADAAQSGCQVQTLFLTADAEEKGGERLKILLKNAQKIYTVTEEVAEKLSDTVSSQGVFAILQMLPETALAIQKGGKYVVLDTVQNPQNLGAIARTAEAFGVNGLIVGGGCDRYNPKALRASMGSLLRLPVFETEDLAATVREIGKTVPTFATVPDCTAESICTQDFSGGAAAIIGNEGNGVSEAVLSAAQKRVTIPMRGNAESLNAAAAATVTVWEMMK
ncbi:MAG: RNA methyltransferase [Ruminococcus sp.]|nr:RNA methyltransferase [Ruminococcus sp.]